MRNFLPTLLRFGNDKSVAALTSQERSEIVNCTFTYLVDEDWSQSDGNMTTIVTEASSANATLGVGNAPSINDYSTHSNAWWVINCGNAVSHNKEPVIRLVTISAKFVQIAAFFSAGR